MRDTMKIKLNDNGNELVFRITQLPATKGQRFLMQLLDIPEFVRVSSLPKDATPLMIMECLKGVNIDKVEALFDLLYPCAEHVVDNAFNPVSSNNIDSIISEPNTLFGLQAALIQFNMKFFTKDAQSTMASASETKAETSFNMRTSRQK